MLEVAYDQENDDPYIIDLLMGILFSRGLCKSREILKKSCSVNAG